MGPPEYQLVVRAGFTPWWLVFSLDEYDALRSLDRPAGDAFRLRVFGHWLLRTCLFSSLPGTPYILVSGLAASKGSSASCQISLAHLSPTPARKIASAHAPKFALLSLLCSALRKPIFLRPAPRPATSRRTQSPGPQSSVRRPASPTPVYCQSEDARSLLRLASRRRFGGRRRPARRASSHWRRS